VLLSVEIFHGGGSTNHGSLMISEAGTQSAVTWYLRFVEMYHSVVGTPHSLVRLTNLFLLVSGQSGPAL
jgi:hypothetical protein